MDSQLKRGRRRRCAEVESFLQSRLYLTGACAAVLGVCALFYAAELVLPRHWVVGALLRLVFIGGVVAAGHHVYTHVLPAALRQSSARRGEGEEEEGAEGASAPLDAAARAALAKAAQEAADRSAAELLRELEEEEQRERQAAAAAEAQRKAAAALKRGRK
jgi:hypothetical protein